jgi:hypothetical protein
MAGLTAPELGAQQPGGYHDAASLAKELQRACTAHPAATLSSYGESLAGRPLYVVTLAEKGPVAVKDRPALLIVAGIDGHHLVGTEMVLHHLTALTAADRPDELGALLAEHAIYLVPRANPDGAEFWFADRRPMHGNLRATDDDRDGAADEDGPLDLDGDGVISTMRVKEQGGTWIADEADPRVHRAADPLADEQGIYRLYPEGRDQDGDGEIAEDGRGDVQVDRNFMHAFQEHQLGAGTHPLSEPEALALTRFVLDRPSIAMVLTYGPHDTLSEAPKADDARGEGGEGRFRRFSGPPKGVLKEDAAIYAKLGERYAEAVETKPKGSQDHEGAFWSTAYFQFGILSLATPVWSVPLDVPAAEKEPEEAALADSESPEETALADSKSPAEAAPSDPESAEESAPDAEEAEPAAERSRRGGEGGRKGGKKDVGDEVKMLRWNDGPGNGAAFVEWRAFDHPDLGAVEIGGFRPMALANPPVDQLEELGAAHTKFVTGLLRLFPKIVLAETEVEARGAGVYAVKAVVVNEGYLPTSLAMGDRTRGARPTQLDLDLGEGDATPALLLGTVRHTWRSIAGRGSDRKEVEWLLKAAPESSITLHLWSQLGGTQTAAVKLP